MGQTRRRGPGAAPRHLAPLRHPVNSEPAAPVYPAARALARVTGIAALLVVIGSSGCIEIEGGAVELSWSLRSFDGQPVDSCDDARLDRVRICWQAVEEGETLDAACRPGQFDDFPCGEENGASGFEIAPGRTAFWIEPLCEDGGAATAGTYEVPPPIVRTVEEGRIVTLNSLLIVVTPEGSPCPPSGCTCQR